MNERIQIYLSAMCQVVETRWLGGYLLCYCASLEA